MSEVQEDGATLRHHLESIRQQTGRTPEALESVDYPAEMFYLWEIYLDLRMTRTGNGFGPTPLSYVEIEAWARLNRCRLLPYELAAIRELDACDMRWQAKQASKQSKKQSKK